MEPEEEMGGVDDAAATAASALRNIESLTDTAAALAAQKELVEDINPPPPCRDDQWATLDETEGAGLGKWQIFDDEMFEGMGLEDAIKHKICQEVSSLKGCQ